MSDKPDKKDEPKAAEPKATEPKRRPAGAATYDRVHDFLKALHAEHNHAWPLASETLRTYIGDEAYISVVNYERAEKDQEPLPDHEALAARARLFDRKTFE